MIRKIKDVNIKLVGVGSDSASSSSTTNTLLTSLFIPADTIKAGTGVNTDSMVIRTLLRKGTSSLSTYTVTLYWNATNDLTGAVQLAKLDVLGTWNTPSLYRVAKTDTQLGADRLKIYSTTTSTITDIGDFATGMSTISAIDFSIDGYLIVAAIRTSIERTPDSIVCSYLTLEL